MSVASQDPQKCFIPSAKPPVINVYCSSNPHDNNNVHGDKEFADLGRTLCGVINTEVYTVYHLKPNQLMKDPWIYNTELLVISSCVNQSWQVDNNILSEVVFNYLKNGGKLLCFAPGLLSKKQSQLEEKAIKPALRTVQAEYAGQTLQVATREQERYEGLTLEGSTATILASCGDNKSYPLIVREEFSPLEQDKSPGIAILSDAILDKDPAELSCDPETFIALKSSNAARFNVLTDILSSHLGIDCSLQILPVLTPAVLLAQRTKLKHDLLQAVQPKLQNGCLLKGAEVSLLMVDCEKQPMTSPVTGQVLPLLTNARRDFQLQYFQPDLYWKNLQTKVLGQTMLYVDVVPTTMPLLDSLMYLVPQNTGLIAVAGKQTHGRGRGGNRWVSPEGCAMFTLHVQQSADSDLGRAPVFLQHMCGLAMVLSIRQIPGYEDIDLRIKWSNDIVFGGHIKLGGVLVNSMIINGVLHAIIGAGLNVSNSNPTACVNDVIRQANEEKRKKSTDFHFLNEISKEEVLARTVTIFEKLVERFQKEGIEHIKKQLYKYWIHHEIREFQLEVDDTHSVDVTIAGLNSEGHLLVTTVDKEETLVLNSLEYSMDIKQRQIFKKRT